MAQFHVIILVPLLIFATVRIYETLRAYTARSSLAQKNNCKPPKKYPHKEPILGLDLFYSMVQSAKKGHSLKSLVQLHETYGRTFQATSFGETIINTTEPKILTTVLATKSENFGVWSIRAPPATPLVAGGVFTTDGADWAHSRGLIKPCFARAQVADLVSLKVHVDRLVELIPKDGSTFDLQTLFSRLSLDSSTGFLFGESLDSLLETNSIETEKFLSSFNTAQYGVGERVRLGKLRFLYRDKRYTEACKSVHSFIDNYVVKAVNNKPEEEGNKSEPTNPQRKRYILLDEMAKVTKDTTDLRYQILSVFLAGHEATAVALGSIFFHLARNRAIWDRLRSEVKAVGNAPLTFELLKSMQYLRYVISENLRLNPVAPLMSRMCLRDTVLPAGGGPDGGDPLLVTRGQTIAWSTFALHRDSSFWGADVESFRPERWEDVRPRWEYIPFGGGTRICPAQQLALTEIGYVVVRLVQTFKTLENRDPEPWEELLKMTLVSKNGVQVGMFPE